MAQDICQEAFLRAYARLKDLREKERFASWLFRIAVNLHRSVVRRPWFQNEKQAPQVIADSPGSGPDTPAELRIFIRRLLAGLASEHREVVILKVYHGFDFQEIAAILDCPVSTVKSRLYKAFEELRQSLKDQPTA